MRAGQTGAVLARLRARISAIGAFDLGQTSETWARGGCGCDRDSDGLSSLLPRGMVHEWFGVLDEDDTSCLRKWTPPIGALWQLTEEARLGDGDRRLVVWIGRRCWPNPELYRHDGDEDDEGDETDVVATHSSVERTILIDPADDGERLWAIDTAVRSTAVGVVVADGTRLDRAATRRLQLAARHGDTLVMLARPPSEQTCLSVTATRWAVRPAPPETPPETPPESPPESPPETEKTPRGAHARLPARTPRWEIELTRSKGLGIGEGGLAQRLSGRRWIVEWKHAARSLDLPAAFSDRSHPSHVAGAVA